MEWQEYLISILSGLAVVIPLVIQLAKWIQVAMKEKNWRALLELVTNLMEEAEEKFNNGADRKAYVLACVEASAHTINYDIDLEEVSKLIDSLCAMTKVVNAPGEIEAES